MAFQFLPILKILAPIATAVIPSFTSKPKLIENTKIDPIIIQQIEELQIAVADNAASLSSLAANLQQTIQSLAAAEVEAKKKISAYQYILFAAFGLSISSMVLVIYLLVK